MLRSVSESSRRHSQALSYIPSTGTLLAGGNTEYRLDGLLAEGGEGRVFEVKGRDDVVAKIYKDLDMSRKEKLRIMTARGTKSLRKVSAWPISALSDSTDETVGFVMESLVGWEPLHNVYQIRSRLKLFPHNSYAFLVRAARNLATCVHHLHEEGIVVGDLNESNVLVNGKAMVKLIDADSFQVPGPTALFSCKVGKAELLPPELQGHSLEGLVRTPEHDRFALSALIFQTLVFGRHPFAGTGPQDVELTLETCIERGYYAYTTKREIPVRPPPNLNLDWLPDGIRELFEQAFDPQAGERPTAKAWYFALKELETSLSTCKENPSHQYWSGIRGCPWCELEDRWRIALFRPALADPTQEYEVGEILAKLAQISYPANAGQDIVDFDYKVMPPAKLSPWESFFGRASKNWGWFIFCFFQIVNMLGTDRRGVFTIVFIAAVVMLLAFGMVYSRSDRLVRNATRKLGGIAEIWKREADPSIFANALQTYYDIAYDLRDVKGRFERGRQRSIEELHAHELHVFLDKYKIFTADAGTLGHEKKGRLDDHGIKSAADISESTLRTFPSVTAQERADLIAWRRTLEMQFWKSHNYKLTIHQERKLIVDLRKQNDIQLKTLENGPMELELLAERLRNRQEDLAKEADKYVAVLRQHGPKLLALEGKKAT
jgi:DNA-binding helix-hairpin-helix protein with protein kinase domain